VLARTEAADVARGDPAAGEIGDLEPRGGPVGERERGRQSGE